MMDTNSPSATSRFTPRSAGTSTRPLWQIFHRSVHWTTGSTCLSHLCDKGFGQPGLSHPVRAPDAAARAILHFTPGGFLPPAPPAGSPSPQPALPPPGGGGGGGAPPPRSVFPESPRLGGGSARGGAFGPRDLPGASSAHG